MLTTSEASMIFALMTVVIAVAVTLYHSHKINKNKISIKEILIEDVKENADPNFPILRYVFKNNILSIIFSLSVMAVGIFLLAVAYELESNANQMLIELYKIALPLNLAAVAVYLVVFALVVPNPKFINDQKTEGTMILWLSMASLVVGFLGFGFCYAISGIYGIETQIILFTLEFAFILYIIKRTIEVIPAM